MRIPNGYPRDEPRVEVGEDVRVGVRVRVGAVECELYRELTDFSALAKRFVATKAVVLFYCLTVLFFAIKFIYLLLIYWSGRTCPK